MKYWLGKRDPSLTSVCCTNGTSTTSSISSISMRIGIKIVIGGGISIGLHGTRLT